jgi:hypothetical protein
MHNQCRSMSIGMAKSTGGLVPRFKENQMKSKIIQTLVEYVLAIVIFGGIGVLLAWRG